MTLATKAFAGFDMDGHHVRVVVTDPTRVTDAAAFARAELDAACEVFSTERPTSELQRLNRSFGRTVRVGAALADHLRIALDAAESTDGAVDPVRDASFRELEFDGTAVRLPGFATLDLTATAPAVAVARVAETVARRFGCGVLVSMADHVAAAGPEPVQGWQITVADGADRRAVTLASGSVAVTREAADVARRVAEQAAAAVFAAA
ncbi:FAD:protein FMN transferase [Rhodococcoides corynebacterioides]|uniref:FAD:protein FMN transferase n=1 Tax=Rhodococcoides corynebacterioides TaxID=53972 RepID=UPI00093303F3|nr:FAD:protein FMN transferase [Rhodococcus corynebacterioides]MBY6351037.1 FAD:protein FMN transferase [Rhodococcus corynebacterioides]